MIWPADSDGARSKPFLEHLEDLRKTILRVAVSLGVGMLLAIPAAPTVVMLLKSRLTVAGVDPDQFLKVMRVAGGLAIAMRVVFWTGLLLSTPFILIFIGNFVFPGLTSRERRVVLRSLGLAALLFVGGVCMGYFMTIPVAITFMLRVNDWLGVTCSFVELADYVSFVLRLLIAFGLAFELPVVVLALGSVGIVNSSQLRDKRRHVIVALLVLSMLLTPQDPLTMILMALPLTVLYEMCIWAIWLQEKKRGARRSSGSA